jgi:hypothetical protein
MVGLSWRLVLAGSALCASYATDFVLAWVLGVLFQYFAIRPMEKGITRQQAIGKAIRADTASIIAFEVGMFAWMGFSRTILFPASSADTTMFWFMMQIAMEIGLATAFTVNRWLVRNGLKHGM